MVKPKPRSKPETFVLTVYRCGCEELVGFHAGAEGDFERDVEIHKGEMIRQFFIQGRILKERTPDGEGR